MATRMNRADDRAWDRGQVCESHKLCRTHPVKRACGHVDSLHYGDQAAFIRRRTLHGHTPCADCEGMAEQGFIILDNAPQFKGADWVRVTLE